MKVTHEEFLEALKVVHAYKLQVYDPYELARQELEAVGMTPKPITGETLMTDLILTARTLNTLKYIASWFKGTMDLTWNFNSCEVRVKDFEGLKRRELREMRNVGVKTVKDIEDIFFEAGVILK
jgi:hypothetical protein